MNTIIPITPEEVGKKTNGLLPDFVITAVNKLIIKEYSSYTKDLIITQEQLITVILLSAPKGTIKDDIFRNGWLDIEETYRNYKWKVIYDKPVWNEAYDPYYRFTGK